MLFILINELTRVEKIYLYFKKRVEERFSKKSKLFDEMVSRQKRAVEHSRRRPDTSFIVRILYTVFL